MHFARRVAAAWSGFVFVLVAFVDKGLALFGLARRADLVAKVHAARGELAGLATSRARSTCENVRLGRRLTIEATIQL